MAMTPGEKTRRQNYLNHLNHLDAARAEPDPRLAEALAMIRDDPMLMRGLAELAAVSAYGLEEAARACAQVMVAYADARTSPS